MKILGDTRIRSYVDVLILVLVEDTLEVAVAASKWKPKPVLILVLVEDTLEGTRRVKSAK